MNFRELDLNLLLVLDSMLQDRSTTAVARRLGISQPTVSTSLRKLRDFFDDTLFVRTAGRMEPTPKALALADPVRRMVQILQAEVLNPPGFDPTTSSRTFTINTTDVGEIVFVPPILRRLQHFAPNATVECQCLPPRDLKAALSDGEIDLAIGFLPQLTGGSIMVQSLFEHPFVCLVREGHPDIADTLSLEQYASASHIALEGDGHNQKHFEAMISKAGIARRITFTSRNFMNVPFIVRDSDMIATVPKVIAVAFTQFASVRALRPPFEIAPIPLKQYWHQKMHNDPAQVWLRRQMCEIFLNNDPTSEFQITPATT